MRARASFLSSINQNHPTLCLVSLNNGTAWTSFSEALGLPANQVTTAYWFPWYNNLDLNTQIRFANLSSSPSTVTVTIGGVPQAPFPLAAGQNTRVSYPINNGPVKLRVRAGTSSPRSGWPTTMAQLGQISLK
jgi:hypothetical protein